MLLLTGNHNLRVHVFGLIYQDDYRIFSPLHNIDCRTGSVECSCYGAIGIFVRREAIPVVCLLRQAIHVIRNSGSRSRLDKCSHAFIGIYVNVHLCRIAYP